MDIFFQDPTEIPLPPEDVRIRELLVQPWPDGQRVRVYLEVDPFQRRPSADLTVRDASGNTIASASIIESMYRKIEVTLHMRPPMPGQDLTLHAVVFFVEQPPEGEEPDPRNRTVVDTRQVEFSTPEA